MSDYRIIKTFEGDKLFDHWKEAEQYIEYLSSLCEQQGLSIKPLKFDIDDYHGGHRYTCGYEVVLDCEDSHQYNVIKLLI